MIALFLGDVIQKDRTWHFFKQKYNEPLSLPLKAMLHGMIGNDSFLTQHNVAMLEQSCNHSKQYRNNVATLCCAKNRRCESFRVTSP